MKGKNLGIFFIIVGIGLLIFTAYIVVAGINRANDWKRVQENGVSVEATITNTWSETHTHKSNGHRTSTTYYYGSVEYYYNGQRYTNPKISFGTTRVSSSETVTMYIDPDDPSISFYSKENNNPFFSTLTYIIFGIMGGVVLITGISLARGKIRIIKKNGKYTFGNARAREGTLNAASPNNPSIPRNTSDGYAGSQNSQFYTSYDAPSSQGGTYNSSYGNTSPQNGTYNSSYGSSTPQDGTYSSSYGSSYPQDGAYNSSYGSSYPQDGTFNSTYDNSFSQGGQNDDSFLGTYIPQDSSFNSPFDDNDPSDDRY